VRRTLGLAALTSLAALPVCARTWTVGGIGADFPLIGPAVSAAADGDTVLVRGGVYREDVVVGKRIALVGDGHPILFGTGEGTVLDIRAPEAEVRGLDIEGSGTGLTNRMDAGVRVAASGVRVERNRLRRVFYGVVVEDAREVSIRGNEIAGFADLTYGRRGDGLYLYRAAGADVRENRITGMRDAIYLQYSPRCRVIGNRVGQSRYGLHDMFSDDAEIRGNTFFDCSAGANVMNSERIQMVGNRFTSNRGVSSVGLSLKECDRSAVRDNDMIDNARGLQLEGSSQNRLTGNRFVYNDVALWLFSSAEENVFSENEFRDNRSGLVLSGGVSTNRFSENGRGNRWDDYRGFDFEGTGVGSSPHPLLGAFEKLEGNNAATRLFFSSPAAGALELAARSVPPAREDLVDPAPLFGAGQAPGQRRSVGWGATAAALLIGASLVASREMRPCSRS
jgi:nitrous oxidase accessory protein